MHRAVTMTAIGVILGTATVAQDAQQQPQQPQQQQVEQQQAQQQVGQQQVNQQQAQPAEGFVQTQEGDVFVTRLLGVTVFAPQNGDAQAALQAENHVIDSAQLADFATVGTISDVMMSMDGQPRGIVIALAAQAPGIPGDQAATPPPAADPGQPAPDRAPGTAPGAPAATMAPGAAPIGPEVAVEVGNFRIFADINAPDMLFAVVGAPWEELRQAPMVERHMAVGGTGPVGGAPMQEPGMRGWMMGRQPMGAPGIAVDGFQTAPVAELPLDDLVGAPVYGTQMEQIGSIGDVRLGPDGEAEYVIVDVGGFLGIGTRQVAIGFDEMTVLRDEAWQELQVHVAATRQDVEALPEYESN
jgi:hypothetical protein